MYADGGDVRKSGKIRCGGLPKGLGLFGVQRRRGQLLFFVLFFFVGLFSPEREQNMAFLGATVFFAAVGPWRVMSLEKKEKVSTKKTSKISKKSSPRASDTGNGSYKPNAPDL